MSRFDNQRRIERPAIDFTDPSVQDTPECRAVLELLRKLSDHFQPCPEETTDLDWTAFRALAKAGAAEGVIRSTCTYVDGDGPSTEHYRVAGDYPSAMPSREILKAAPFETALVQVRLTATGVRWAEYLSAHEASHPERTRGVVLRLLWTAEPVEGSAVRVGSSSGTARPAPVPDAPAESAASEKGRGKRGPDRMPLRQAWRYVRIVQEWAGIRERNSKLPMRDRYRKIQLAEKHGISLRELDAMLGWYAKHRRENRFPDDPRTLSRGELEAWFE